MDCTCVFVHVRVGGKNEPWDPEEGERRNSEEGR